MNPIEIMKCPAAYASGYENIPAEAQARAKQLCWEYNRTAPNEQEKRRNILQQLLVNDYQKAAMTTLNPALDKKDVLINSVMGLCGESGEAIDIVKKWLMQGHELDKEHLIKELGDVAWYLAEAATALDIPLETVFQGNLDKLHQRFPNGFDTEASVHRRKDDI